MRSVYALALAGETLIILSVIGTLKLATLSWGEEGFAQYSIVRRLLAFIIPIVVLGLDVGIPRFVAMFRAEQIDEMRSVLVAAVRFVLLAGVLVASSLTVLAGPAANVMMGSSTYSYLMGPLSFLLLALSLNSCVYSYLRGRMKFFSAVGINVVAHAVLPVICFWFVRSTIAAALCWQAVLTLLVVLVAVVRCGVRPRELFGSQRTAMAALFVYSARRVPAALLLMGISTLPVIVATHSAGIVEAGFVAFGVMLVGSVATALSPVGFVLLPAATRAFVEQATKKLRTHLWSLTILLSVLSCASIVVVVAGAGYVSQIFFAQDDSSLSAILRIMVFATLPLNYYTCMRNVLDARYERSVNSINVLIAFAFMLLAFWLVSAIELDHYWTGYLIGAVYVASQVVLGALTYVSIRSLLHVLPKDG